MNIRQVLIEVMSQSTNDLRGPFVGHIHFKKPMEFQKFMKCFTAAWPDSGTVNKISFNHIYL